MQRLTEDGLKKVAWKLALPMLAGGMLHDLFSLADMFFVGKLGPEAIAAVTVASTALSVFHVMVAGLTIGCASLVALALGAGDRDRAALITGQSLLLGLLLSLLVSAIGISLAEPFLRSLGAKEAVVDMGKTYFIITAAGAVIMFTDFVLGSALRGAGDAMTPLKAIVAANVLNLILDPLLIFGWMGFPRLGVAGSAWATLVSRWVACIYLLYIFFVRGHPALRLRMRHIWPNMRAILDILKIGIFGSGQVALWILSGLAMTRFVAEFGTVPLAAFGIGMRIRMVVMMPGFGLGNAAATLVGQNVGANKMDRAIRAAWFCTGIYLACSCLVSLSSFVGAEWICLFFTRDPGIVEEGAALLRWFSLSFIFLAPSIILGRAMNGAGDTFWPMLITAFSIIACRIPLAYHLSISWGVVSGIWFAWVVSDFLQCALNVGAFCGGRWQTIGLRTSQSAPEALPVEEPLL